MKNKYDQNDDINFEIKNYKFNPVFIDKKNNEKKEKGKRKKTMNIFKTKEYMIIKSL